MSAIGYEYLRESLALSAFAPPRPALVKPVTRIEKTPTWLAVPSHVAPASADPLPHVLFALKHEGVNLQLLAQAMPKVTPAALVEELRRTPNGSYIHMACYLWETFSQNSLEDLPPIAGPSVDLFNPRDYITGRAQHNARWRVAFNGLGSPSYCATVERTPEIRKGIEANLLGQAKIFLEGLDPGILDRTLAWAYMNETRDSFAIEHETPSEGKAGAFVALLRQAHDKLPLSEDYLVQLQTATVSNPGVKAAAFRTEQNWLGGAGRGAQSVTYLPPPPALVPELMHELMAFANDRAGAIDPIIAAGIVSFGFVFIHPFMDGNGRLSRFLFHQALCRSDQLPDGLVLPVSIAMKKNEREYLQVLQEYSRLARQRWNVTWLDADRYDFTYTGDPGFAMYRYWDATSCVEFGFRMAEMALQTELRQETRFIANYDAIATQINERFDLRGSDLSTLIVSCLDKNGVLSKRRRDQFASRVPEAVFAAIEDTTRRVLADTTDDHDGSGDSHKKPRGARIGKR